MFQWLYDVLWLLAPIWIRRYLDKRSGSAPAYRAHRDELLGKPHPESRYRRGLIHAVSVGETRAAQPLIRELRRRFPDAPLLMTQMTPTGRETAQVLFPDAQCRYLPYDKNVGTAVLRTPPDVRHFDGNRNLAQSDEGMPASGCRCFWRMRGCRKNR